MLLKSIFYDWGGLNLWLFHVVNAVRGSFVDMAMQFGSNLGDHTNFSLYVALIAVAGLILSTRAAARDAAAGNALFKTWMVTLVVLTGANVIDGFLVGWFKDWLDFPRPPGVLPPAALHVIGAPKYQHSLPSGHAAFAMTLAASLWPVMNRLARLALAGYVLWVGLARISLGMHFPADVMAGYVLALTIVLVLRFSLRRYDHRLG